MIREVNGVSPDEILVGSIAVVIAVLSMAIALGPWIGPYQLKTISAVSRRFGKPVARGVWIAIALASFAAGLAILSGLRPHYAVPPQRAQIDR